MRTYSWLSLIILICGGPVKNVIEPIDATPEELARAICLAVDKKLAQKRKIKTYGRHI